MLSLSSSLLLKPGVAPELCELLRQYAASALSARGQMSSIERAASSRRIVGHGKAMPYVILSCCIPCKCRQAKLHTQAREDAPCFIDAIPTAGLDRQQESGSGFGGAGLEAGLRGGRGRPWQAYQAIQKAYGLANRAERFRVWLKEHACAGLGPLSSSAMRGREAGLIQNGLRETRTTRCDAGNSSGASRALKLSARIPTGSFATTTESPERRKRVGSIIFTAPESDQPDKSTVSSASNSMNSFPLVMSSLMTTTECGVYGNDLAT
jgi:hypothetical protein